MKEFVITQTITPRDSKSLVKYFSEVSKIPMLTAEEEKELTKLTFNGDERAIDKLVRANLRFVISVAKQYQYNDTKLDDLINEGNLGLIEAAKRFDPKTGNRFLSYAVWWIRSKIFTYLDKNSRTVRIPTNKTQDIRTVNDTIGSLSQTLEREPSTSEVKDELKGKFTDKVIDSILEASTVKVSSYDVEIDEGYTLLDTLPTELKGSDEQVIESDNTNRLNQMLNQLPPIHKEILMSLYGINCEQASTVKLGEKYGVSPITIRSIRDRSMIALKRIGEINMDYFD
jgi:RNA polymerase primary sigma factor